MKRAASGAVGKSVPKTDARAKVTGATRYVDDLVLDGMLHAATVRSTIAAGRITKVTLDPAFDWSGITVVDHRDIPGKNVVALIADDQPALAQTEVRHAEEPIVLLAAANRERLLAAARAVHVEYEPVAPVLSIEDSLARRRIVHAQDNVFAKFHVERGHVDAALALADVVVEGEYTVGWQEHVYIETNGVLAWVEPDGTVTVTGSLQCPFYVHKALCALFALPAAKVRVIQAPTGGGFGGKEEYPSMIAAHAALLAWKSRRPVKLVYDRAEDIAATTKRHPGVVRHQTGVTKDGRLLAQDIDVVLDGGAYATLSSVVLSRGTLHAAGPYRCDSVRIRSRVVATNTPPNGAFRGFGAPQTLFAAELQMERIASALGIDPVKVREQNLYRAGDVTPTGQVLGDDVGAAEVLSAAVRMSGFAKRRRAIERTNARKGSRTTRGLGVSLVLHGAGFTGSGEVKLSSVASVELSGDGRPRALAASTEIGQGTNTIFAQLVGDGLGVSHEMVEVATPDTAHVPDSGPTVASRTCMVVGNLLHEAAKDLRERLLAFDARGWKDDRGFRALAKRFLASGGDPRVDRRYAPPPHVRWNDATYQGDAYGCFSWAANVVEVEVDLSTFEVRPTRLWTAQEIGRAIHPRLAEGQIEGGALQALGWATSEDLVWKEGRIVNAQLTNYVIPTSLDAPPMAVRLLAKPYAHGPFGAKGVGELPMDGPAPALVAAVLHATGRLVPRIPLTPERMMEAMR